MPLSLLPSLLQLSLQVLDVIPGILESRLRISLLTALGPTIHCQFAIWTGWWFTPGHCPVPLLNKRVCLWHPTLHDDQVFCQCHCQWACVQWAFVSAQESSSCVGDHLSPSLAVPTPALMATAREVTGALCLRLLSLQMGCSHSCGWLCSQRGWIFNSNYRH